MVGAVLLVSSIFLYFVALGTLIAGAGGVGLLVLGVLLMVAAGCRLGVEARRGSAPIGERQTTGALRTTTSTRQTTGTGQTTGAGRAVLRTMRTVNDVRAMSRGPAAYGKRVARRVAFRSLRKW